MSPSPINFNEVEIRKDSMGNNLVQTFTEAVKVVHTSMNLTVFHSGDEVWQKLHSNRSIQEKTKYEVHHPNCGVQVIFTGRPVEGAYYGFTRRGRIFICARETHSSIYYKFRFYGLDCGCTATKRSICCKSELRKQIFSDQQRKEGNYTVFIVFVV